MPLGRPLLLIQVKDARVKGRVILGLTSRLTGGETSWQASRSWDCTDDAQLMPH